MLPNMLNVITAMRAQEEVCIEKQTRISLKERTTQQVE